MRPTHASSVNTVHHCVPDTDGAVAHITANLLATLLRNTTEDKLGEYEEDFRDYLARAITDWMSITPEGQAYFDALKLDGGERIFCLSELIILLSGDEPDNVKASLTTTLRSWGVTDLCITLEEVPDDPPPWEWGDRLFDEYEVEFNREEKT